MKFINLEKLRPLLSFRRSKPDYTKAFTEFTRALTLIVDFEQLLENLLGKLREIADIPEIIILLRDLETDRFDVADSRGMDVSNLTELPCFLPGDKLVRWLTINETPLIISENPGVIAFLSPREQDMLSKLSIQLVVPLIVMNRVNGMVLLGEKRTKERFTKEELELLTTLLNQCALAFENALLYQEQKQRLRKMFRADRLATIGQIAAGAAHEIRNPLTSIRSTIQYLRKKDTDPDRSEMLEEIMSEVDRIDEIIHGLLSFSKPVKPQKENVDLAQLIQQVLTLATSTARRNQVQVQFDTPFDSTSIQADPGQMKQVFLNIIFNAIQAMQEGGRLIIQIENIQTDENGGRSYYRLQFRDTGCGIPDQDLERIFDPFYTTKKEGTGLGLSISYGIIQQHGGEIEVESSQAPESSGTRVTVSLPAG